MSTQKFSAVEREAIWLAHAKKCAYSGELLDISNFHIDHIIPELLADDIAKFNEVKSELGLPSDFNLFDYGNLLPCGPSRNLQKRSVVFEKSQAQFFLGIASSKKNDIYTNISRIESRKNRGRAIVLLQQCLEREELSAQEVSEILQKYADQPEEIFHLIEGMHFLDSEEIRFIAKADIENLRNRPIQLGENSDIDGVTLTNADGSDLHVRTCMQYDEAIKSGYYAFSNFDLKMSTWFKHQCGLLTSLESATTPTSSYISEPRVSVLDLSLLPYSLFPSFEKVENNENHSYQTKVDEGVLIVKRIKHNLLQIEEADGMGQQLVEVARADFNGDGIEDILLFEYCYATHGTLGYGGIRIITRTSSDAMFEIVHHEY